MVYGRVGNRDIYQLVRLRLFLKFHSTHLPVQKNTENFVLGQKNRFLTSSQTKFTLPTSTRWCTGEIFFVQKAPSTPIYVLGTPPSTLRTQISHNYLISNKCNGREYEPYRYIA